jgi:quercetin dioxygenase-like cupin family protein
MSAISKFLAALIILCCSAFAMGHLAWGQKHDAGSHGGSSDAGERDRTVISQELPKMDGDHLKVIVAEVVYGPGAGSAPHSHPCAVIGYVAEGTIRSQVKGGPEITYKTGESFYEPPNGVHLVSANGSKTKSAKLIAYLLCDHEGPLSVDVPQDATPAGAPK